jgi:hypothetical protein
MLETRVQVPERKVMDKFMDVNFPVWPRLTYTSLTPGPRQLVFDSVHGLTRNGVRLHEQGRAGNPDCLLCPGQVADVEHMYCHCLLVRNSWLYVQALVYNYQPELGVGGGQGAGEVPLPPGEPRTGVSVAAF